MTATTAELLAELATQAAAARLSPGEEGWWQVWGATAYDILPGDAVATAGEPWFLVSDTFTARSAVRLGIVVDGERQTIGAGCRVVILRHGTHHTLADSV